MSISDNIDDAHGAINDAENLIYALQIVVWDIVQSDRKERGTEPQIRALLGLGHALGRVFKEDNQTTAQAGG